MFSSGRMRSASPELGKVSQLGQSARDCDAHRPLSGLLDKGSAVWQPPKVPPRLTPQWHPKLRKTYAACHKTTRTFGWFRNQVIWWISWRISSPSFCSPAIPSGKNCMLKDSTVANQIFENNIDQCPGLKTTCILYIPNTPPLDVSSETPTGLRDPFWIFAGMVLWDDRDSPLRSIKINILFI